MKLKWSEVQVKLAQMSHPSRVRELKLGGEFEAKTIANVAPLAGA